MLSKEYLRTIMNLEPGDHVCYLYESEEEHRAVIAPFLREGLEGGQKVLYVVDAHTGETILGYLRADGLALEPYLERGQLAILTAQDTYMREGAFDPDRMIALLKTATERALAQGYSALRVSGEMSWALRGVPGAERLIEYEAKLNAFSSGSRCLGICQYDRRRFPAEVLLEVLATHPIAIFGTKLHENPYYMPPREFLSPGKAEAALQQWLKGLEEHRCARAALRAEQDKAQVYLDVAGVIMVVLDAQGKITQMNKKGCEILGCTLEEALGQNWFETFLPERVRQEVWGVFRRLMAGALEPVEHYENPVLTRKGDERVIAWHNTILPDGEGRIIGILSSGEDITERKHAEGALKESEARYRALYEGIGDAIYVLDEQGIIVDANRAALEMYGFPRDEFVGQHVAKFAAWADRQAVMERLALIRERGSHFRESLHRRSSGGVFPVEVNSRVARVDGATCVQSVVRDISERKQAEAALRESEEKVRSLVENMGDGMSVVDENGIRTYVNDRYCEITGYTREELVGHPASEIIAEASRGVAEEVREKRKKGERGFYELELIGKGGRRVFVRGASAPLFDANGSCRGGFSVITDVTGRKEGDEALRRSEELYRSIAENVQDGLVLIRGREMAYVNDRACEIFGYSREELMRMTHMDVAAPEEREWLSRAVVTLRQDGVRSAGLDFWILRKDGTRRFTQNSYSLIEGNGGAPTRLVVTTDITERRFAEEGQRSAAAETLLAVSSLAEAKDPYTSGHSQKVTEYALGMGKAMALPAEELENLRIAALLHDVGKVGIPDGVLNKPGRLTRGEWLMIHAHPVESAEVAKRVEAFQGAVPAIRHHHEAWDGTGYPDNLREEEIPLAARILAVADWFEAMTSARPYRQAKSREEALAELRAAAGVKLDPEVVRHFLGLIEEGKKSAA